MKKFQQITAIILIVILLSLYAATLITGILATESSHLLFNFSVTMTFVIPVVMYILMLFTKLYHKSVQEKMNAQSKSHFNDDSNSDDSD